MRRLAFTAVALASMLACAPVPASVPRASPSGTSVPLAKDLARQFEYDANAPLDIHATTPQIGGAVSVSEIDFADGTGGRARATLMLPDASAVSPGMVFMAGSNQSRSEVRSEALRYAQLGIVILILDQSQIASGRQRIWTFTSQDRSEAIASVVSARRALDLLAARADVDRTRLGFFGFSYGAWLGVMADAVDGRIALTVLRSGGPQILEAIARSAGHSGGYSSAGFADYQALMKSVDQIRYAPSVRGPVLVQNGSQDPTYTADEMRIWQEAIGGDKTVRTYAAGHALDETSMVDVIAWLREKWGLRS
jgi:dienelactone hydrolase